MRARYTGKVNGPASEALDHLMDRVRHESVCLAVDPNGGLRIRRVHEAEDPSGPLVNPIAEIANAVPILGLEIGEVCLGNVGRLYPTIDRVSVHEKRHEVLRSKRHGRGLAGVE